jgi:hypothetical protein
MLRSDRSDPAVPRRDRRELALRSVHVALRGTYDGLRRAQDALRPVVRPPLPTGSWEGPGRAGNFDRVATELWLGTLGRGVDSAAHGAAPEGVAAEEVAINSLPRRLETHYVQIRRLREESRQLCEEVVRLLGERPGRSRPYS